MRSLHPARLLIVALLVSSWLLADPGWSEYRDPQGLFSLSRPNGWAVKPMPEIHTIVVAQSDLCYLAMGAEANTRRMDASQLAQQLLAGVPVRNQNGGVRRVSASPDVACVDYVFYAPQGQPVQGKIMASADASMCYAIFYVAPQVQFEQALPVLCRIAASFRHVQVALPAALYGGQEQVAPQPWSMADLQPAPCPDPGDGERRGRRTVDVPAEWAIEWTSESGFKAGNRKVSPTEGAMVSAYEIEGAYAAPADTMVTVLTQGYGCKDVQTRAMVQDEETASALAQSLEGVVKVEAEIFFAKFTARDGTVCLGLGYGVTMVERGARDTYHIAYAFYFASRERFDVLVPAFQRTAQSIMAWRGVGDVVAGLGRGSVAAIRTLIDMQATSESSPRPRRQGGGLVDKLGPSVRSR